MILTILHNLTIGYIERTNDSGTERIYDALDFDQKFNQTNKIVLMDIYYLSICEISQCKYSSEGQNGDTKTDPQNAGVLTHQPKLLQMPKNRCLTLLPGK